MARRYWTCRKCKHRNERTSSRKCQNCGEQTKPKKRVPKHAVALRDVSYERYNELNALIHGVTDESCAVCGKPRSQEFRHDRDHGHLKGDPSFGKPRGLTCVSCNRLMPRELSLERARLIALYLERVETFYAQQEQEAA